MAVMSDRIGHHPEIDICDGDLTDDAYALLSHSEVTAWDIETSGLDYTKDQIATVQVWSPLSRVVIVRVNDSTPTKLKALLEAEHCFKLFHHAMFDLRFMVHAWSVVPTNVGC